MQTLTFKAKTIKTMILLTCCNSFLVSAVGVVGLLTVYLSCGDFFSEVSDETFNTLNVNMTNKLRKYTLSCYGDYPHYHFNALVVSFPSPI